MVNLADISEPHVPPNGKKIHKFDFRSVYSVSMGEKQFKKYLFSMTVSKLLLSN